MTWCWPLWGCYTCTIVPWGKNRRCLWNRWRPRRSTPGGRRARGARCTMKTPGPWAASRATRACSAPRAMWPRWARLGWTRWKVGAPWGFPATWHRPRFPFRPRMATCAGDWAGRCGRPWRRAPATRWGRARSAIPDSRARPCMSTPSARLSSPR